MSADAHTLLFDLDGTLTDSRPGIVACIRHALLRMGAGAPDDAALRECLGPPLRGSFAQLLATDDAAAVDRAIGHYRERFDAIGWRENAVYPGIADALAALAARGHRMLVCTSKPLVYAQRIVAHFGFDGVVERVYGPGLDGALDDKRALLAEVIRVEKLDPARTMMIGDRHYDVRAARANSTLAVGVLWGYGSRDELASADRLVAAPADLAQALAASSA
jgi:phosphoglycolate phosphatase